MILRASVRASSELPLKTRSFSISNGIVRRSLVPSSVMGLLASDDEDSFKCKGRKPPAPRSLRTLNRVRRHDDDQDGHATAIKIVTRVRRSCRLKSNQETPPINNRNSIITSMKNSRKSTCVSTTSDNASNGRKSTSSSSACCVAVPPCSSSLPVVSTSTSTQTRSRSKKSSSSSSSDTDNANESSDKKDTESFSLPALNLTFNQGRTWDLDSIPLPQMLPLNPYSTRSSSPPKRPATRHHRV